MSNLFLWSLRISRVRFWPYLFGPFLVGAAAAPSTNWSLQLVLLGFFFTLPANLMIYGFNDIFDYETDKHNPKKSGYEQLLSPEKRKPLLNLLFVVGLLGMALVAFPGTSRVAAWAMVGFYFFGIGYSVPPLRAKTKPFIDVVFNILYVFPGLVSYGLLTGHYPKMQIFIASGLWCMAMHAYSAIPDIAADKKAHISTIATFLGARTALIFCLVAYVLAAILTADVLRWLSILAGVIYGGTMIVSLLQPSREHVFKLYKIFPVINVVLGALLFFKVAGAI